MGIKDEEYVEEIKGSANLGKQREETNLTSVKHFPLKLLVTKYKKEKQLQKIIETFKSDDLGEYKAVLIAGVCQNARVFEAMYKKYCKQKKGLNYFNTTKGQYLQAISDFKEFRRESRESEECR